ncbi:MAG: T9SS type A sorting domain-containing protein, partial [Flavobacteriaceae bacterium]|nr:T9SS type A sorting domain-containing protein [Flavobacteriaceae bacterium]
RRWGWSNYYETEGTYTMDLYAGAAHCDVNNGVFVGTATVDYNNGEVYVTYNMLGDGEDWFNYVMTEAHVYVGCDATPNINGSPTVAPGQYTVVADDLDNVTTYQVGPIAASGAINVIVHAVTCEVICHCSPWNTGTFVPEEGSYDSIECEIPSETINDELTDDNTAIRFQAYPVPFDNEVFIRYNFTFDTSVQIELFDLRGVRIINATDSSYKAGTIGETRLDMSNLDNQMFIVKLSTNNGTAYKKIVSSSLKKLD